MAVLVNGIGYGPVLAPQDAMLDAGLVGGNNRILPCAQKMALTIVDSNTIRAGSGVMITSEGKRIQTMVGEYDDFSIPAGTAGTKRYYIIGYHLHVDGQSKEQVETFARSVSGPQATIQQGALINGDSDVYVSRAMIQQDGTELTILSDYISIYTGPGSGTSDLVYVSENFLYESGYSAYSQSDLWKPYAAKFGRVVDLYGAYKPASKISSTSGNGVKVGTVPAGFRPLRTVTRVQNANDTVKFLLTINPSGEIWVARSTASGSAINAGAALRISCSYISST